jgi:hypothetical protein
VQKLPELKALAGVKPLRHDLFAVLPSGAYGLVAYSQPAKALQSMLDVAGKDPEAAKEMNKAIEEMQKETGLDLRRDVMPSLEGNAVFAAYPSASTPDAGIDLLLVVDDTNGANPAAVAEKLQAYAQKEFAKEKPGKTLFASQDRDGARYFMLSEELASEVRKDMGKSLKDSGTKSSALIGGKTFAFAMVDKALIAATSKELLDRAVQTYRQKTSALTGDPTLASSGSALTEGSQTLAAFSLSRIAKGVGNTLETEGMDREAADSIRSILSAFQGLDTPLLLKGNVNEDGTYSGGAFVPMDYDKLLDFIGKSVKE